MLALKLGKSLSSNDISLTNSYTIELTGTEYITFDSAAEDFNAAEGSVSVWTRLSSMSASGFIFRIQADSNNLIQLFYHNASGEIRFAYKAAGTTRTVVFDGSALEGDGDWHHLLATWKTSTNKLEIFLDGVSKATQTTALGTFAGTPSLFDVGQNTAGANFYKGLVAEFGIFERNVTTSAVYGSEAKNRVIDLTGQTGLKGYWKFNEGSGAKALDSSGNGKTGDIFNTPTWSTSTPQ